MRTGDSTIPLPSVLVALIVSTVTTSATTAEDLSGYSGPDLYRAYCASCHGVEGHGDGPVASSLRVEVPDLTQIAHRQGGRFPADQIRKIIDGRTTMPPHGTRYMPVWGGAFRAAAADAPQGGAQADALVELLVRYLRSIQRE